MVYNIKSNRLSVSINSKGAEISSAKLEGLEYIWQAKPDVWPRRTPVLFPIVGRLKNNAYTYKGQKYTLSQHGFARDKEFKCIAQSEGEIVFELADDTETKKVFPFEFKFVIKYTLENDTIVCSYEVSNPSSQNIYFSVGAHPGFKVPLTEHEKFEDYILKFKADKQYEITELADGLLSESKVKLHTHIGELNLSPSLFEKDALVFENSQIDVLELASSKSGRGVEIKCSGWPYFGIWSKKGCNEFVCLEPWYGITDSENNSRDLKTKKGIIELIPGLKFECNYSMRFF